MQHTYKREEKLKKAKLIGKLFSEGSSVTSFPIKLVYFEVDHESSFKIQAGMSVSKRNFKRAVDRNRIKRLLRESYRKNKQRIYQSVYTKKHIIMFIYIGKNELKYSVVEEGMNSVIDKFLLRKKK